MQFCSLLKGRYRLLEVIPLGDFHFQTLSQWAQHPTHLACTISFSHSRDSFVKTEIQLHTMFSHIWRHRNYSFHFKNQVPRSYPKFTQEKIWWANTRNNGAYVSKFLKVLMTHVVYSGAMCVTGASYKSLISSLGIPSASAPRQPPDLRSIHTVYFVVHSSSPCVGMHWS